MNHHFYKINGTSEISTRLAKKIEDQLSDGPVLWLISGGSAIEIAADTAKLLKSHKASDLTVSLVDERYGAVGHPDSNWQQLMDAGFAMESAKLHPVLNGSDIKQTAASFEEFYRQQDSYKLALLGMGTDGHTAGILPGSPAINSDHLVSNYDWTDYQRITLTFNALKLLDEVWLYATGKSKESALRNLKTNKSPADQPAQIIKQIPQWSVYNDLIGD